MAGENTDNIVRFGVFEVDVRARELRRQGTLVELQDQPFQVLAMLLERPGQVVTREELRARIWGDGVFVDFDKSLSKAINKIRDALGDFPEGSPFIETLAKRGYRFLGQVESGQPAKLVERPPGLPATPRASRLRWGGATLLVLVVIGAGFWMRSRQSTQESAPTLVAIPLTTFAGDESNPSFSPDGNQVAFAWNGPKQDNFDIYVKQIGSENTLRLTSDPADDFMPVWSPDGRHVAFLRALPNRHCAIMMVPSLGGPPERKLAETFWAETGKVGSIALPGLSWSPDGKWIATKNSSPGDARDSIYLVSVETSEQRRLTVPPPDSGDGTPGFSPDGRSLAFSRILTLGVSEIYMVDLSPNLTPARPPRQLTFAKKWTNGLAWTSDGREIVYSSGTDWAGGSHQLWRLPVLGSGTPRVLAVSGEHGQWPALSRHGNRLAFPRQYVPDQNIWRLELSGPEGKPGTAIKLIASTRNDYVPQYSPDGTRIVFISQRSGADEVMVCNSDGSGAVQLTSLGASITGTPRWSPNGKQIVFDSNAAGNFQVYVIDADGGRLKRLTVDAFDDGVGAFSRDGRSIYFVSNRTKLWEVWKMLADGRDAVQMTRNGGYYAFESVDGAFLYYAKEAQWSDLWRMPARGGEATKVLDDLIGCSFVVLDNGIYFIRHPKAGGSPTLQFLSFGTGKVRMIASIPNLAIFRGLSVSQDGRSVLYTQEDQAPGSDLMLVENFK